MSTNWGARFAMVGALAGCKLLAPKGDDETCTKCGGSEQHSGEVVTTTDSALPIDTADALETPGGVYRYDPDCVIGAERIPTVYYVQTYTIDGTDVTGTDEMVWVSHPSTGIPVCSFSWPVTGTAVPCTDDCDLQLELRTGEATNNGCLQDRARWGDLFANADGQWLVWNGTGDEVRVAFDALDEGHGGVLVDGVLAFQYTQCNGL